MGGGREAGCGEHNVVQVILVEKVQAIGTQIAVRRTKSRGERTLGTHVDNCLEVHIENKI
jgi:hypothetical protein